MTSNNFLDKNSEKSLVVQRYFDIDMRYKHAENNNEIGRLRQQLTVVVTARFGLCSPTLIASLYSISKRQALEHLNKLVKQQLLICIISHRSVDGRIYICDSHGAKFAEEFTKIPVHFRRHTPAEKGVNQNTIMHDLMNAHILLSMMQETSRKQPELNIYLGLMTEREFKRQMTKADTRIVDGLLLEKSEGADCIIAIELENSFKTKAQRSAILLRYLEAIKARFYDKVFLISQSHDILNDIKRFHTQLFDELIEVRSSKTKQPLMSTCDVQILKQAIIYRTKYCDELTNMFYR
jgi:hypothetical protein